MEKVVEFCYQIKFDSNEDVTAREANAILGI